MMTIEIKVPDIGSEEVEVTEIMVRVGDKVEVEQSLITVEGNKASMEIPAPFAGIVKEINIHLGDKISTGSLMMLFETIQESESREWQQSTQLQSNGSKEVLLPDIGSEEVEVTEIMVRVGDKVEVEQSLITVEGNKASMEIPAPFAGIVKEIKIAVGDKIITNSLIMILNVEHKIQITSVAKNTTTISNQQQIADVPISSSRLNKHCFMSTIQSKNNKDEFVENDAYIHATPVIRRLARQFGINLAKVKGNGRKGRILYEDIQTYVKESIKRTELMYDSVFNDSYLSRILIWPKVNFAKFGNTEEIELSRIQKISGSNLHRNWMMIPQVTQFDEADITELEAFRKQQNADAEKKKLDVKITMLVFIMKAVAKALEELPRFNSSLSADAQTLTLKKYINIGVAVDTPTSLVVPVFHNANNKGIIELSGELLELSKKARAGKLTSADMQGGCFSISSLGGIGGTAFTPIVNAPEVAILGIAKSSIKPVWNGKEFAPKLMLPLSLSYDHRVINGADGVRFMNVITNILSDIRNLIL